MAKKKAHAETLGEKAGHPTVDEGVTSTTNEDVAEGVRESRGRSEDLDELDDDEEK